MDWDAEWKKVVENKDNVKRPRDKTMLEAKATNAANDAKRVVARNVYEAKEGMRRQVENIPSFSMLQGDWKVSV